MKLIITLVLLVLNVINIIRVFRREGSTEISLLLLLASAANAFLW